MPTTVPTDKSFDDKLMSSDRLPVDDDGVALMLLAAVDWLELNTAPVDECKSGILLLGVVELTGVALDDRNDELLLLTVLGTPWLVPVLTVLEATPVPLSPELPPVVEVAGAVDDSGGMVDDEANGVDVDEDEVYGCGTVLGRKRVRRYGPEKIGSMITSPAKVVVSLDPK